MLGLLVNSEFKIDIKNIAFYNIPDWFSNIGEIMICREAE